MGALPLIGGHSPGISSKEDSETCVNLFVEPTVDGKGGYFVNRPGYSQWNSVRVSDSISTAVTIANGYPTATVTYTDHGFENGDSIVISGANEGAYNGTFTITWVNINSFTYTLPSDPGGPATGSPVAYISGIWYTKEVRLILRDFKSSVVQWIIVVGNRIFEIKYDGTVTTNSSWPRFHSMYGPIGADTIGDQENEGWILSDALSAHMEDVTPITIHRTGGAYAATLLVFSNTVTAMDGYIIRDDTANRGRFIYSELYDVTTENPFAFATVEGSPDDCTAVLADRRELWLFGEKTTEVWYNAGNADLPFKRFQGGFLEVGTAAPHTAKRFDNSIAWLAQDRRGGLTVVRAGEGFQPTMISTPQINKILQASAEYVFNAYALVFRIQGHEFYVLTIPGANANLAGTVTVAKTTLVYDAMSKMWFHWASSGADNWMVQAHDYGFDPPDREFGTTPQTPGFLSNVHLIGGNDSTGKLYAMDLDTYTDDGTAIDVERILRPVFGPDIRRINAGPVELETDMDANELGTVTLNYAKDSKTFGSGVARTLTADSGRFMWKRLGRARRWIFKLTASTTATLPIRWLRMISRSLGE